MSDGCQRALAEFETHWAPNPPTHRRAFNAGWDARTPEVDALKAILARLRAALVLSLEFSCNYGGSVPCFLCELTPEHPCTIGKVLAETEDMPT